MADNAEFLGIDIYKRQIIAGTSAMIIVPFSTFFYMRSYLTELWITSLVKTPDEKKLRGLETDVDTWSALAAVFSIQSIIIIVILLKYSGDILDVFVRNRGEYEYGEDGTTKGVKGPFKKPQQKLEELVLKRKGEIIKKEIDKREQGVNQE